MSAVATNMIDFITAIERETPKGLHPCYDEGLRWDFVALRDSVDNPAAAHKLIGKIVESVVQELEFSAENDESAGYYRDAWRSRRRAERFAARFNQPCEPMRMRREEEAY